MRHCNFCYISEREARILISSQESSVKHPAPAVYICDGCIKIAGDLVKEFIAQNHLKEPANAE